ncbi:unnamed protein product [Dibothriocephalus latus]|uniref:Aminotransferase class V domain-containing protein n=1 Tax=Dibothriocephalus latus TaxID=60516 RepID=A0A3P7LWI5_DIBLA|nr:unnamed protein product [Dibothriocephalus latus]
MKNKVITFAAGPTKVPTEVKEIIRNEMLDFQGTGLSILETMHRSKQFIKLIETCEKNVRQVLNVPENYKILFLQVNHANHTRIKPFPKAVSFSKKDLLD